MVWDTTIEPGSSFGEWFMVLNRLTLLEGLVRQLTKHRFYRAWITVKPVGSTKSCRPKANPATKMLLRPTVQRNEPDRLVALVIPQAGNLRFSPPSSHLTQDPSSLSLSSLVRRPIAPFSPRPTASPSSSTSSRSVRSVHRERSRSPHTPMPPMAPAPVPSPVYPVPRTPMCDARRYRSLFSRHRVAPPTPPPPSPPPSDEKPSAKTYDPAADLEGDPDEPYVAERAPYGAPEAYYPDTSDRSERESASAGSAPSSHHSSGSFSGSVSLGYGSASSGSASNGASDDDLVNCYFAGTFPPP
ncbi:hypothetical protein PIB30_081360 [Stylosanthes scabra]|uniref:Uncharacterized protein n=1 Tax=Stylosanthes scabra TaxID=79078 RepID=A0ABU6VQU8_9FABA|nr:hypothetical protein [Stylosanthes scabra]